MPELPEVETVCRGLRPYLQGQTIQKVRLHRSELRFPFPKDFAKALENHRVEKIERRAKYIQMFLDNNQVWLTHLGMSGRFILPDDQFEASRHDHVVVSLQSGNHIYYRDPRRFGYMDICDASHLSQHRFLSKLGPEPIGQTVNVKALLERLLKMQRPLKTALLDQTVIAGLGNIYVCEALYQSGLSPWRLTNTLSQAEVACLVAKIQDVLAKAIQAGGSTLRDYAQVQGELGYFQHQFQVYGRASQPCFQCGQPIGQNKQGGRSTFYCSVCQAVSPSLSS